MRLYDWSEESVRLEELRRLRDKVAAYEAALVEIASRGGGRDCAAAVLDVWRDE